MVSLRVQVDELAHLVVNEVRVQWVVLVQARIVIVLETTLDSTLVLMRSSIALVLALVSSLWDLPELNLTLFQLLKKLNTNLV